MRRTASIFTLLMMMLLAVPAFSTTYVVCAGIAKYKYINKLTYPVKDAQAMANFYKTVTNNVVLLVNENATHDNILSALRQQFSKAGPDDMVIFFFSGHGGEGALCPYDCGQSGNFLMYSEVFDVFRRCNALRKMMIVDACHAGGLEQEHQMQSASVFRPSSVIMFLSSRRNETSLDGDSSMNKGVFSYYVYRGLCGAADSNGDKRITAKELFNYVYPSVVNYAKQNYNHQQHPQMWGKFDDNFIMCDLRNIRR